MNASTKKTLPTLHKDDYEKLAHFRHQLRRFLRFSEELTHRHGITVLQYLLMLQIKGFPGRDWATVGELAERLQAQPHGVVSLVTRCEEAGLVRRHASDQDKRRVEVKLTPKGERYLETLALQHRSELQSLEGFPAIPGLQPDTPQPTVLADPLYRGLMEQAPDAMIYADRSGLIRFWNRAAESLFGHAAEQALGQSLDLIIPERLRAAHWAGYQRALSSGEMRHAGKAMTTRAVHRDGSKLYVELSFGLLKDNSGQVLGSLAIGRDVTAQHNAATKPAGL
ncbi:MAG: PAS domain S-box protein [Betaproteobacteria bacterium]|nr:PAS domain S-box protein [Betaproteobacteria bacterium]